MSGNKRVCIVLQDRDRQLLDELGVLRIMDRQTASIIGRFVSVRRANHRLLRLTRAGLLRRFFVGSIAHGRKAVYTLSAKGAALVSAKLGGIQRPSGRLVVGDVFVEHQSGINQIYLALRYQPIPVAGARLLRWISFHQAISDQIKLTPDGYFEIAVVESVRSMFLEIDLGTEALSIWQQKIGSYLQLAVSGEFRNKFRQPQFRVLVITSSDRRVANIRATVSKSTDKIFWFTTFENIHREGLWSPIWLRPTGDEHHSLL